MMILNFTLSFFSILLLSSCVFNSQNDLEEAPFDSIQVFYIDPYLATPIDITIERVKNNPQFKYRINDIDSIKSIFHEIQNSRIKKDPINPDFRIVLILGTNQNQQVAINSFGDFDFNNNYYYNNEKLLGLIENSIPKKAIKED